MTMLISKELLVGSFKRFSGFVPVYKPAGLCCLKLGEALRLDLYFVLEHHDIKPGQILMNNARYLEPFASGLMTFIIGKGLEKRKNFALAKYVYNAVIEFGVERELHCIDGPVVGTSSISGVSESTIRKALPNFIGFITQTRCNSYRMKQDNNRDPLQLLNNPHSEVANSVIDVYNEISLPPVKSKEARVPQKYPYVSPKRSISVYSIELINYSAPYGEFNISCQGGFSPRQFTVDLASMLGSKASLVSLKRLQEGPMTHDDPRVLQLHEMNLEYYLNRLPSLKETYKDFNDQIDPLWDDIPR